jgi:hypothetical protein
MPLAPLEGLNADRDHRCPSAHSKAVTAHNTTGLRIGIGLAAHRSKTHRPTLGEPVIGTSLGRRHVLERWVSSRLAAWIVMSSWRV